MHLLVSALVWLCGQTWRLYARLCQRSSSFALSGELRAILEQPSVPTLFLSWHDERLLSTLDGFQRALHFPPCSVSNGFLGRALSVAWRGQGGVELTVSQTGTREQMLRRLERGLQGEGRLLLTADYGTPRFAVRPLAWQLGRRVEGCRLVPLHVAGGGSLFGLRIPLPFQTYMMDACGPFEAAPTLEATRATLSAALKALRDPDLARPAAATAFSRSKTAAAPSQPAPRTRNPPSGPTETESISYSYARPVDRSHS